MNKDNIKTEKDFVFNGLKDWNSYKQKQYKKILKEDKIPGGEGDNITIDDLVKKHNVSKDNLIKELEIGIKHEMEHTKDEKIAKEIAMDHLSEHPDYYTKLNAAKLEEAKKKTIIRTNYEAGATPPESVNGPGTVSATSTAVGPAPGTTAAIGESHMFVGKSTPKETLNNPSIQQVQTVEPNELLPSIRDTAEQYLRAGEAGGLETMTIDGRDFILDHLDELTPKQQMRFNKLKDLLEESKKKLQKVGQGSPRNDGTSTTKPSKQLHKKKTDYDRKDKSWTRLDESENRSKYFKDAWNNYKK